MKKDRIAEAISAYMDGESDNADEIARRIQQDAVYAKRYVEFSKLATHLRRLSPPEVQPAFLTRVMARVNEAKPAPGFRWAYAAAITVSAAVLVALLVTFAVSQRPAVELMAQDGLSTGRASLPDTSPDTRAAALAELERRAAEGQLDEVTEAVEYFAGPVDYGEYTEDELYAALGAADWFESFAQSFEAQESLDTLIDTLSEEETDAFESLLETYTKEEWVS